MPDELIDGKWQAPRGSHWCDYCQDHYRVSHFDGKGNHRRGKEWGPDGWKLGVIDAASDVVAASEDPQSYPFRHALEALKEALDA